MITINCTKRIQEAKGGVGRLRREGRLPFVLYAKGQAAYAGVCDRSDIEAVLRNIRPGFLPTTVFVLKDEQGGEYQAIVREIQYKPTTYEVLHVDFLELIQDRPVMVKVPVEFTNTVDCVGIKLGGMIRHILRHVKVKCAPKHIPSHFSLDLRDVAIGQAKRVRDIPMPEGCVCLEAASNVVVTIVKK